MKAGQVTSPAIRREGKRMQVGMRSGRTIHKLIVYGLLIVLSIIFILPFMWMVSTSLKQSQNVFSFPPQFLPTSFE